jgi:hypothetical protein
MAKLTKFSSLLNFNDYFLFKYFYFNKYFPSFFNRFYLISKNYENNYYYFNKTKSNFFNNLSDIFPQKQNFNFNKICINNFNSILFFYYSPLVFKYFLFSNKKNSNFSSHSNISKHFSIYNHISFLKDFFFTSNNTSLFNNNIFPDFNFNYIFKKKMLKIFNYSKFPTITFF